MAEKQLSRRFFRKENCIAIKDGVENAIKKKKDIYFALQGNLARYSVSKKMARPLHIPRCSSSLLFLVGSSFIGGADFFIAGTGSTTQMAERKLSPQLRSKNKKNVKIEEKLDS